MHRVNCQPHHSHLYLTLLEKGQKGVISFLEYLSVERVAFKFIFTLELPGVSLIHGQSVLISLKYLDFINLIIFQ